VTGVPDTWWDGLLEASGAYTNDTQMYNWYYSFYNTRRAVPTDTTIDLSVVRTGDATFDVTCTVAIESGGSDKSLTAHIVQVRDHYPSSADNRYRNCTMSHQGSGTFSLAAGESYSFNKTFTLTGASYPPTTEIKFIAFVQDNSSPREVYNSTELAFPFYVDGDVDRDGDVDITDLGGLLASYGACSGDANYVPEADFDWDQCITLTDLSTLLANYGYAP